MSTHPLLRPDVRDALASAVSAHLGRAWTVEHIIDLNDRASHPCGICAGSGFAVFAKFSDDENGVERFELECAGLRYLAERGARTPARIGTGVYVVEGGSVLLLQALRERSPADRTPADWQSLGRCLAELHTVTAPTFGLADLDGYFGPLRQDNRPVPSNTWAEFLRERRLLPFLDEAIVSGNLPVELIDRVRKLADNLESLVGPEPVPVLLHGDAQQNNYLSTDDGAVIVDASPFYGHPENDLALIELFTPVPAEVFDAYREVRPIDVEFDRRRELWRIPAYLAIVAVDGNSSFGRTFVGRLAEALELFG